MLEFYSLITVKNNNLKMKIFLMIFLTFSAKVVEKNDKKDRKLYENLTSSYLLGDTVDAVDTSHLSLLVG